MSAPYIEGAVAAARAECGTGPRANYRSCFYSLRDSKLELVRFDGRPGDREPRRLFDPNEDDDEQVDARFAVKIARGENVLFVPDLHKNPPPSITKPNDRSYRTMLVAPVNAGGQHFGMFSLDSPDQDTFSEVDQRYILLIAGTIAAGLIQVHRDGYAIGHDGEFTEE